MDFPRATIAVVYFGVSALEITIFLAGTLFVRKEISQLAGWRLFCFFALCESCSGVALGTGALLYSNVSERQTAFQVFGVLNLASCFFLGLFCYQLNRTLSNKFISIFAFLTLLAGGFSEYSVAVGGWGDEFLPMPIARQIPGSLMCAFALSELFRTSNKGATLGLRCMTAALGFKLMLGIIRIVFEVIATGSASSIGELPNFMYGVGILRQLISLAPFLFVFAHWLEQLLDSRRAFLGEAEQIKALLKEKTILLDSMADFSRAAEAGGLTAALTHEISQPLSAVALNAAVLKARLNALETPPEIELLVDEILSNNLRTSESVHHLRQIFQPVVQGQQAPAALIDPKIVLDQILSIVASRARQSKVSVAVENSNPDRMLVRADDFYTLTLNFVLNALDALEESARAEKKITIYCISAPSALTLIVDDNGKGIHPDFTDQVFNLRKTTKPKGMGVGLWLCEQLCRNRGYSISFNSAPNEGTEFKVSFPANAPNAGSTPGSAIQSAEKS